MTAAADARVLYRGGSVYSPADPFATAMLVDGGHIAWVGSDEAAAGHAAGLRRGDEVIDLDGALITPAFVDAHVHVTETGLALGGVDLSAAESLDAALDAVAHAAAAAPGSLVLGTGWDESAWPGGRGPSAAELDRAGGGAPVYLARADVHSAVVSSSLAQRLDLASLPGWRGQGLVTGTAHHAARDATRDLPPQQRRAVQERALAAASAVGIGCLHECSAPHVGSPQDARSLLEVAGQDGRPDVLLWWGEAAGDEADARRIVADLGLADVPGAEEAFLGLGGDLGIDGSIGSRTAALREPYADAQAGGLASDHRGQAVMDAAGVRDHVVTATRAGWQAGFHVIGDAALDIALEGFAAAAGIVGASAVAAGRHRLEHVEMIDTDALAMMARLGLTASVQPAFDARWGGPGGLYARRLGEHRAQCLNPFAALAAAGVPLALGSDSPVTGFAPWEGVRAAAFTHTREHRTSVRAAFLAATRGGWRAARRDGEGTLVPGAAATYAIWERADLLVQAPDDRYAAWSTDARSGTPGLPDLTPGVAPPACLRTVVRGTRTHQDPSWAAAAGAAPAAAAGQAAEAGAC